MNSVTSGYDALGRLVTEIFPDIDGDPGTDDRPEFTYTYDEASNLVSVKDALDNVTVYGYDYRDRITTITDPDPDGPLTTHQSPVTSFTYDDANRLTKIIDPLSRVTDYRYDGLNRLIRAFYPDADGDPQTTGDRPEISYSYDALGNELSMTDALGNVTTYEYDNLYRLIELTEPDPDGPVGQASSPVTSFQYDAASQLLEVTDPLARTTTYQYDNLGRVTNETYPDPDSGDAGPNSPFMDYVYDLAGNLLSQTDALGHATSYGYDNLYRMTSETDANADTVDFTYDLVGNLATLTDPPTDENPTGNTTMWVYDSLDRVTEERNDVGDSRFFVYDLMNNLVERTDRNGRVLQFDYDQLYRRTAERWLDATETTIHTIGYTYDAAGQVLSAGDVFANYGYTYDGLSRVTQVTHDIADLVPVIEMNQQFDLMNNRTQLAAVIGGTADFVTDYGYDNLHRMTRVEQAFSLLPGGHAVAEKRIDLAYDLAGQFQSITRFADLAATKLVAQSDFTFDLTGRLTDLVHSTLNSQPSTLASYTWTFDVANRVTQFESLSDGIVNYTYDYRDQLKTADYNYQTDEDYVYDENGNRTSYSSSLTGGGQEGVVTGDLNRLISDGTFDYEYDNEGNRTKRIDISSGETTVYAWDHRNRLVTISTYDEDPDLPSAETLTKQVTQIYDAYNRWIGRKVDANGDGSVDTETFFIYDGNQIVLQFDGTEVTALSHRYLWGPQTDQILADEAMADLGQEGDVLWPLTDNLGTVRDLAEYDDATDTTAIVDHYVYDAFGNETDHTGSNDFLFKYTGRAFDQETGLQNNLNRWFDPVVGRWLSEDPIGFEAGDANVYRYVGNAATLYVDPSGLDGVAPQGRPGTTIANQNGVRIQSHGTNDVHKPAHAHVTGGNGPETRVGANGHPLDGQPDLTPQQKRVVDANKSALRKEVNKVGRASRRIEDWEKAQKLAKKSGKMAKTLLKKGLPAIGALITLYQFKQRCAEADIKTAAIETAIDATPMLGDIVEITRNMKKAKQILKNTKNTYDSIDSNVATRGMNNVVNQASIDKYNQIASTLPVPNPQSLAGGDLVDRVGQAVGRHADSVRTASILGGAGKIPQAQYDQAVRQADARLRQDLIQAIQHAGGASPQPCPVY